MIIFLYCAIIAAVNAYLVCITPRHHQVTAAVLLLNTDTVE